jgi:hypothetical protein
MDARVEQAQRLFWEISLLRQYGAARAALPKLTEMARLHEKRAIELLDQADSDGWIDFYAAITAWGEAGQKADADRLLQEGHRRAIQFPYGRENIDQQLNALRAWLNDLRVLPSLRDFARPLPTLPVHAA